MEEPIVNNITVVPIPLAYENKLCTCCVCELPGWDYVKNDKEEALAVTLLWATGFILSQEECVFKNRYLLDNQRCAANPDELPIGGPVRLNFLLIISLY